MTITDIHDTAEALLSAGALVALLSLSRLAIAASRWLDANVELRRSVRDLFVAGRRDDA